MTCSFCCTLAIEPSASTLALVQHGDAVGDLGDEIHVVLDHDQRVVTGQRQEQLGAAHGLVVGHAGHRFVQQQ